MTLFHSYGGCEPASRVEEYSFLRRSADGGRRWSDREQLPVLGREQYFTVLRDGTLLTTSHLIKEDARNDQGDSYAIVHRSTDAGKSWTSLPIRRADLPPGEPGKPADDNWIVTSRNVLELADGTLLLGVSTRSANSYAWTSTDRGASWDASRLSQVRGFDVQGQGFPWYAETLLWEATNGDVLGLARCNPHVLPPLPGTEIPTGNDQIERMALFRSTDRGSVWTLDPEIGSHYGEHYPSLLRLRDGRLLLTFTVRSERRPLGVHAVLGEETAEGFRFDFDRDRIVLDRRTPDDQPSGGGFGNTVQLPDGELLTAYSYRDAGGTTHVETVRWRLP
jgi:hypothetical protein